MQKEKNCPVPPPPFFLVEIRNNSIILALYKSKRKVSSAVELLNASENFGIKILNNLNSILKKHTSRIPSSVLHTHEIRRTISRETLIGTLFVKIVIIFMSSFLPILHLSVLL